MRLFKLFTVTSTQKAFTVAVLLYISIPWYTSPRGTEHLSSDTDTVAGHVPINTGQKDFELVLGPRIVWLMSFPNSGTSYTMRLVKESSQTLVATNYQKTVSDESHQLIPVYSDYSSGPFWQDPSQKYVHPSNYVLTKTHCGTRCNDCRPSSYLYDSLSFTRQCLSAVKSEVTSNGDEQTVKATYDSKLVHKAIHLIRDPYDNIVSRFHLERRRMERANDTEAVARYPDSREGFRRFCQDQDDKYLSEVKSSWLAQNEGMRHVLCRDDLYRYVQWHNLAFSTTEDVLKLPTYILHYEDFSGSFNETVSKLLDFLDLKQTGKPYPFRKGHTYDGYFTQDERNAVKKALQASSNPQTWQNIQHYFK
jgi:hypothetical protein